MKDIRKKSAEEEQKASLEMALDHYENFPVVSFLVPKHLRKHIALIYRFARQADDIADEGMLPDKERLSLLLRYEDELNRSVSGKPSDKYWESLAETIKEKKLSQIHFFNLLKAFKQDILKKRYNSFQDLLNYCCNSANPVGRLILELYNIRDNNLFQYSDYICSALQLTNFYQDVSLDIKKGRIYFPLDEMSRFDVKEEDFELGRNHANLRALFKFQIDRTREMFLRGKRLTSHLPFPLKQEIGWTILGGQKVLDKIENIDFNVLNIRPKLNKFEYLSLVIKTFIY
ncbi:MAG: squalene synthase HpnC [Clostridiales bacterium]